MSDEFCSRCLNMLRSYAGITAAIGTDAATKRIRRHFYHLVRAHNEEYIKSALYRATRVEALRRNGVDPNRITSVEPTWKDISSV